MQYNGGDIQITTLQYSKLQHCSLQFSTVEFSTVQNAAQCPRYQDNKDIPLLVLANKQDLPSALGPGAVEQVREGRVVIG